MKCEKCDNEYDGRLKQCPLCKAESSINTAASIAEDLTEFLDVVHDKPLWQSWNQTAGGEEIFPGWVLNNRCLYYVGLPSLSPFALGIVRDAFQVKTENRRPVMGDADFQLTKAKMRDLV